MSNQPSILNSTIGEYRVVDFLGAGGMGEVYRAVHLKIGRVAAVKILIPKALEKNEGLTSRFFNEARIQAGLQHPNIATLYDFCEVQGQPCIIMEYVDGLTLAEHIEPNGPLSPAETIRIFKAVLEAVNHIHGLGIVHRDIKSNNIKISSLGQVKLLDFGIAKSHSSPGLTETGRWVGTVEYLSPEQLRTGTASVSSDIWSLGVLLYEMCTGRLPFSSPTFGEIYEKITKVEYQLPSHANPSLPADLATIISRCLRKVPTDRYSSTQDLLRDVSSLTLAGSGNHVLTGGGVRLRDRTIAKTVVNAFSNQSLFRAAWFKRLAIGAGAIILLAFMIFGAYSMFFDTGASSTAVGIGESKTVLIDVNGSDRALVFEDGEPIGTTPYTYKTQLGAHVELVLQSPGYKDVRLTFDVTAQTRSFAPFMQKDESANDSSP